MKFLAVCFQAGLLSLFFLFCFFYESRSLTSACILSCDAVWQTSQYIINEMKLDAPEQINPDAFLYLLKHRNVRRSIRRVFVLNAAAACFIMCVISVLMKPDKLATAQECAGPSAPAPHFLNPAHCSHLEVLLDKFFFFQYTPS